MGCLRVKIRDSLEINPINKIIYPIFEIDENYDLKIQRQYAHDIEDLGIYVSNKLKENRQKDFFFTTEYDDIFSYMKDKDVTVMICQDNNKKIIAASYITQGQGLYTYNDLTKYFKFNKEYIDYAKSKYDPKELCSIQYETFMKKIKGYKYAKALIEKELNITDLVDYFQNEKKKGTFDEHDKVREKVNRYIYDYFRDNNKDRIGFTELDRFYLLKFSDLQNCEDNEIKTKCANESEENKKLYEEYAQLIDLFDLKDSILPDEKNFTHLKRENFKTYFDANPFNTIELDTYMVHPIIRNKGLAKIVTFEGLKIQINKLLAKRPDLEEIFICATIHQDNEASKRVIISFGKFDTLYIKRRFDINEKKDINREVYFFKLNKRNLKEFIKTNEEKINEIKDKIEKEQNIKFKIN
jgi:hypothetical protein